MPTHRLPVVHAHLYWSYCQLFLCPLDASAWQALAVLYAFKSPIDHWLVAGRYTAVPVWDTAQQATTRIRSC